ncbi:uncharacterized protein LOC128644733 [Bombina bombina]|uniref:uncharacterized protein LOC128644733 n=2 Tax=Bombina bombina TaxID=8345 RepID=UPI00235A6EB9|nr:uncharacterized protein LOC128644733 [Bombina bombina]
MLSSAHHPVHCLPLFAAPSHPVILPESAVSSLISAIPPSVASAVSSILASIMEAMSPSGPPAPFHVMPVSGPPSQAAGPPSRVVSAQPEVPVTRPSISGSGFVGHSSVGSPRERPHPHQLPEGEHQQRMSVGGGLIGRKGVQVRRQRTSSWVISRLAAVGRGHHDAGRCLIITAGFTRGFNTRRGVTARGNRLTHLGRGILSSANALGQVIGSQLGGQISAMESRQMHAQAPGQYNVALEHAKGQMHTDNRTAHTQFSAASHTTSSCTNPQSMNVQSVSNAGIAGMNAQSVSHTRISGMNVQSVSKAGRSAMNVQSVPNRGLLAMNVATSQLQVGGVNAVHGTLGHDAVGNHNIQSSAGGGGVSRRVSSVANASMSDQNASGLGSTNPPFTGVRSARDLFSLLQTAAQMEPQQVDMPSASSTSTSANPPEQAGSSLQRGASTDSNQREDASRPDPSASGPESQDNAVAVPGPVSGAKRIWIVGHSYVHWASIRSSALPGGQNLGFPFTLDSIRWLGERGMCWPALPSRIPEALVRWGKPHVIILHIGGNDLGAIPILELIKIMQADIAWIRARIPNVLVGWSNIVPRLEWHHMSSHSAAY